MDVFTMVVLIVAISCGAGIFNNYLKTQRARLRQDGGESVQAELEALRQRVAALEEIVTDQRYQLEREFSQLERSG
jgi:phage shock protein C